MHMADIPEAAVADLRTRRVFTEPVRGGLSHGMLRKQANKRSFKRQPLVLGVDATADESEVILEGMTDQRLHLRVVGVSRGHQAAPRFFLKTLAFLFPQ